METHILHERGNEKKIEKYVLTLSKVTIVAMRPVTNIIFIERAVEVVEKSFGG